MVVLLV